MRTIAAIVLLSCCAFGQDKAAVSATEALSELTESGSVPSTVEGISSCQSSPVNTMSARCCNRFSQREALEFRCIR